MAHEYEANDEVFNLLTRKVGLVINVKEIGSSSSNKKKYVRVMISKGLPDEIWAFDEIALWIRPKRRID